jgi:DNA-binding MarR family transcriptional regulator/GNAT superfamily N-acetyltransferase
VSRIDVVRRFNRFYTRRIGALQAHYLGSPFPLPQARVLYELGQRGPCTASELGADLDLDLGYLSRLLQGLKRLNLVAGERSAHDARHVRLSLTPKGRKAFATLDDASRRATEEMLKPLPAPHRERVVQALQTAHAILERPAKSAITLRAHRAGDMGWVVERHGVLYEREYGWGGLFEALVADIVAKFLRDFDSKREHCWIAERDGQRVGSVFIVKEDRNTAKLRLLLIEPEARGEGLGKRLVQQCIDFSPRAGYRKLVLWTHDNLTAARAIYQKLGFRLVKTEAHRQFGVPVVGEYWELVLKPVPRGT